MLDLPAVGHELRTRRRALRIPSAELARRIGVSPTYVWLIEEAKPRKSGEPSRPSEDLLSRWTAALGMSADEAQRIREFAGYFGLDFSRERDLTSITSLHTPMRSASAFIDTPATDNVGQEARQYSQRRSGDHTPHMAALRHWAGTGGGNAGDEAIVERLRSVLELADQNGRSEEVRVLLNSFLSWLRFHTERDVKVLRGNACHGATTRSTFDPA